MFTAQKTRMIFLIPLILMGISKVYAEWTNSNWRKPNLYSINFVDENTGYIGGKNKLYKTTDAGRSWLTINNIDNQTVFCLSFLDANTGIVAGGPYEYQTGFIYITTDGGRSWKSEYNSLNRFITDAEIINNQVAYAIDELGRLYKTSNLNYWSITHYFQSRCYSIQFVNQQTGWISGNTGKLYKTTDGGSNWETIELGADLVLFDVCFINESVGWVLSYDGTVFKTTDGGTTWENFYTSYSQLSRIKFVNDTVGFITGAGKVLKTTDGGLNWYVTYQANTGTYWENGLAFVDENSGYVVGKSGVIFHTTNSGSNWNSQGLDEFNNFNKVKIIYDLTAYVIGDNGTILKSSDMGSHWLSLVSTVYHNLNSIQFLNNLTLFVVGDSGTIIKSNNLKDWIPVNIPTSRNLNDLYYFDYTHGIVVGEEGTIYKTTDGGNNWQNITSGTNANLNSINFQNNMNGFIAGDNGTLLKTTDGGTTWNVIDLSTTDKLSDIQLISSSVGYINTNNSRFYKTTNGGDNWFIINSYYHNDHNTSMCFTDSLVGWFGTDTKNMYRTSDGGNTWSSQLPVLKILRSINFYDSNYGMAVGDDGIIMRTADGGLPVPVELTSFSGFQKSGKVYLSWQTATELNNQMFEIQRKTGESDWITIGFKPGMGSTTELHNYSFIDACSGISPGSDLNYRLKQIDFNGNFKFSNELTIYNLSSQVYRLLQNYPNPFNPTTTLEYRIPEAGFVTLTVYDAIGNEVAILVNEEKPAGSYIVPFNGSNLSSGIYFYKLRAGNFLQVKKMLLLK